MPADTSLLFQSMKIEEGQVIIMCSNVRTFDAGLPRYAAVMFMNSNKSESSIRRIMQQNSQKCRMAGIALTDECIISKGPDRDIDRDAVNMLITQLLTGRYDTVVVENMTDLTADGSDLKEFMYDAACIGVGFFELSTMQYHMYAETKLFPNDVTSVWDGGSGC